MLLTFVDRHTRLTELKKKKDKRFKRRLKKTGSVLDHLLAVLQAQSYSAEFLGLSLGWDLESQERSPSPKISPVWLYSVKVINAKKEEERAFGNLPHYLEHFRCLAVCYISLCTRKFKMFGHIREELSRCILGNAANQCSNKMRQDPVKPVYWGNKLQQLVKCNENKLIGIDIVRRDVEVYRFDHISL